MRLMQNFEYRPLSTWCIIEKINARKMVRLSNFLNLSQPFYPYFVFFENFQVRTAFFTREDLGATLLSEITEMSSECIKIFLWPVIFQRVLNSWKDGSRISHDKLNWLIHSNALLVIGIFFMEDIFNCLRLHCS